MRSITRSLLAPAALWLATLGYFAPSPAQAEPPADLSLQLVTNGFTRPVAVRHAGDGSGRLFIVEQPGRIRVFDETTGSTTLFLDITAKVDDFSNEQGLLGLAFHPNFTSNGHFYVNYTRDPGPGLDRTVIERYSVSADPNVADSTSGFTLLEIEQDFANHNGGDIHFGPDGFLYIGMGDGGSGEDPRDRSQDLDQLLGKMLRIDVDGSIGAGEVACGLVTNYGIPDDNPFHGATAGCDEIWAYGLRNPWRFSFDRVTGDMFIGDVGQYFWEEIDFQPASSTGGENYGWSCKEANTTPNYNDCLPGPLVDPILDYGRSFGCSVTGGFRYRGPIEPLVGDYLYADYCDGRFWIASTDDGGATWSTEQWSQSVSGSPSSFGEDEAGNLYVTDLSNGGLYRFESAFAAFFTDGFESGNTTSWSATVP